MDFRLYFDESGNFEERGLSAEEQEANREKPQKGPSQLVGILLPAKENATALGKEVLRAAYGKADLPLEEQLHATALLKNSQREKYTIIVEEVLRQLPKQGIQPVRLHNKEHIGFGGKVNTYTSMMAEMVVRIFEELTRMHGGVKINLHVTAAGVLLSGKGGEGEPSFIVKDDYLSRLSEQIAFAAVRRGVAHNKLNWSVKSFQFGSGLRDRPLQLCDLLSNCSYNRFTNCSPDQKARFKTLLGPFDFPLNRVEAIREVEQYRAMGAVSQAVQTIYENWHRPELDPGVRQEIKGHCAEMVQDLLKAPVATRDIYLRQLADWGNQFLVLRDLEMAAAILQWLEEQIAQPLCAATSAANRTDAHWFLAQILVLRLTQHNHRGDLQSARPLCDQLQNLIPVLAGEWEYASLLTEAMTLRAVHLNDSFEFDEASRIMGAVEGFYGNLSSLMTDALPGIFPERVRSAHRGKALGTRLQSEMFAGLAEPSRLLTARQLSEEAIDEFVSESDWQRQYQYRCQIETFAGDLPAARDWLCRSLGAGGSDHKTLAAVIKTLEGIVQGFALLHWTRIGMEAARLGRQEELGAFLSAFTAQKLDTSPWIRQPGLDYPAHGIRRHLAVAQAVAGRHEESRTARKALAELDTNGRIALALIQIAGLLEVAARWPKDRQDVVEELLRGTGGKDKTAPVLQLQKLQQAVTGLCPLEVLVGRLLTGAKEYETSTFQDASTLLHVCRQIGQ